MDARALIDVLTPERGRFVRLARRRVETEADAEDIVQRALLRASERAGSLEDPARARAWFYRILRRAVIDHHRRVAADPAHARAETNPADLAGEESEPERAPCACTARLLAQLGPTYAEAARRVDMNGEDASAVAAALGISPGNLYVRLHRARRILRERLREHCGVTTHRACLDCTCDLTQRCSGEARL